MRPWLKKISLSGQSDGSAAKAFAAESDDLPSIPRTHMVEDGPPFPQGVLRCALIHAPTHTQNRQYYKKVKRNLASSTSLGLSSIDLFLYRLSVSVGSAVSCYLHS